MVIRGNSRGNARQLSHYLLTQSDNEAIRIFEVDGQLDADRASLHRAMYIMGLSSELSKSEKGLYHAQINPAPGELMTDDRWLEATDILAKQLGLENQRRAIVLHSKKGRTHAHVVWERFDHDKGRMVSDSFSRLAQDRARKEMELAFDHKPTPHRNKHRPELKASLLALWNQTGTGAQFVKAARENDYWIAAGSGRSPYVVVDANGRSYDLARQLKGVKLKEVRQRLRGETLPGEKEAITLARNSQNASDKQKDKGTQQQSQDNKIFPNIYQQPSPYNIATGGMTFNPTTKAITKQFMENAEDNYFDIIDRLDKERQKALREYSKNIDFRKQDYDRVYHIQFDEYKLHNKRFGKNKKGIEPLEYNTMLDKELMAYARDLEKQQLEEAREKAELQAAKQQQQDKERDDRTTTQEKFSDGKTEIGVDRVQPAEDRMTAKERERNQRRQEFRQMMQDTEQQRDKDKGLELE